MAAVSADLADETHSGYPVGVQNFSIISLSRMLNCLTLASNSFRLVWSDLDSSLVILEFCM